MKLPELKIGRFTAKIPIVQGGMSVRVSTSSLAAAVAECGGIGTIGGSGIAIDQLKEDIRKAKQMTSGVIAVNIMFAIKPFVEAVKASIEAGVDMIVTGAGFSRDIFKVGREYDVPIVSIVSSPEFGKLAERLGAAAVVVEAKEAGGHLGTDRPLRELFPEVRKVVKKIPLIAAGGITDGLEIAEMIGKFGADAVQMATRFVLTKECDVADSFKQAYLNARKEDVVIIDSPVGLPGRAIRNRFLDRYIRRRQGIRREMPRGMPEKLLPQILHRRPPRDVARRRRRGRPGLLGGERLENQGYPHREGVDRPPRRRGGERVHAVSRHRRHVTGIASLSTRR